MSSDKDNVFHLITPEEYDPIEARLVYCLNFCIDMAEDDETGVYFNVACLLDQALNELNYNSYPPQKR